MAKNENVDIMRATAARYYLEHEFLPITFYTKDAVDFLFFITSLAPDHVGPYLARVYSNVSKYVQFSKGIDDPQVQYDPADFYSQLILSPGEALHDESLDASDVHILRLDMPEPERAVLSARIYFCFSGEDFADRMIYTVEKRLVLPEELKNSDDPPADCLLGGRDRKLNHVNTGEFVYSGVDPKLMASIRNDVGKSASEEDVYSIYRAVSAKTELRRILALFIQYLADQRAQSQKDAE